MVMEAATLSSPQRKCNVVPVQKSLSLPSYARAGGEGIDHRLIFAALEQKESVRRKSKIFTREKTSRQNIFCLPISTGSKCKETDLSSDTSCSSLEYQKPKPTSKPKKGVESKANENDSKRNEVKPATASSQLRVKQIPVVTSKQIETKSTGDYGVVTQRITNESLSFNSNEHLIGHRSPVDTLRLNVGSSDSMERSSRSSNDSLTRKERLVAIKARVEAEREKYGNSSSDDETRSNLTRYNSDGGIHRTVRDVKTRSYRNEKRLRRRSHGEWAIKKADRKNNLSLCLNPEDYGIKLHLEKLNQLNNEINNLEVKTDYCPSPNVPDTAKKNYFSDFPSKENVSRFVQQRIRHIEEEENKRRSGSDFFDKAKLAQFSCFSQEKSTSIEHVNLYEKKSQTSNLTSDSRYGSSELVHRESPLYRGREAPTPPPRSPKSKSILNKTFLHHQNASNSTLENILDKNSVAQSVNSTYAQTKPLEKRSPKLEVKTRNFKNSLQSQSNSAESRDLFNARRKTCSNFDFVDENILSDLCAVLGTSGSSNLISNSSHSCSLSQIKSIGNKSCSSNPEISPLLHMRNQNKSIVNKFEENERRREFMFNSLENKKSTNSFSWAKWKASNEKNESCICYLSPGNKLICKSKHHDFTNKNRNMEINIRVEELKNVESNIFFNGSHKKTQLPSDNKGSRNICFTPKSMYPSKQDKIDDELAIQLLDLENNLKISDVNKSTKEINISSGDRKVTKCIDSYSDGTYLVNGKTSFNFDRCDEDLNCLQLSNSTATANLDSAMAELENVYQSLKLSSDNLSERNSLSNISLSDEDFKVLAKEDKSSDKHIYQKRLSIHTYFDEINSNGIDQNINKSSHFSKSENYSNATVTKEDIKFSNQTTESKDTSINDLFKDLMPHLNTIEKNLRSHDSVNPQPLSCQRLNISDDQSPKNSISSIRLKKEFYENLNAQRDSFQRKKLAAQKLSDNISHLMNSANNEPLSDLPENRSQLVNNKSTNNSPSNSYKSAKSDSWKSESKSELPSSKQLIKTNESLRPYSPRQEEICHIRVSIDSLPSQKPSESFPETNKYSRLSSAVNSPHVSPKCDAPKLSTIPSSTKDSVDQTIDGLEELLNSLLVDVPDSKQSSLSKEPITPTSISAGEMCVMQHLDIIRLKSIPS